MNKTVSPYLEFSREAWRKFRKDTPLTLNEAELMQLKGQNQPVSLSEVVEVYLPLSRLLNLYVEATYKLYQVTTRFLDHPEPKMPYLIAVAGSVAVGKSTTSRILQALLSRWPNHPNVVLVTTDSFLYPNAVLEKKGLMNKKGFPESYDLRALVNFLTHLKAGKPNLKVPVYSHYHYDILPDEFITVDQPDIVILEGINVLQSPYSKSLESSRPFYPQPQWFVSDFFDFSIYVDADIDLIEKWYVERFMTFRENARHDKKAFFHQFAHLSEEAVLQYAQQVWKEINKCNLLQNILPFKKRASLILEKGDDHLVETVYLRKI